MNIDPTHFNAHQLVQLGGDAIHHLARRACGTLASYRLLLGRCLLALERTKQYTDHGCSGSIHYATAVLGMKDRQARQFRRVARLLEELPALSFEAVHGRIDWCKLREVVKVASAGTEEYWVRLCHQKTYDEIERLVALTEPGLLPELPEQAPARPVHSELRCRLSPRAMAVVERALQALSQQTERMVSFAEAVELLFGQVLAKQPLNEEALQETRDKGLARAQEEARKHLEECPVRDTRFNPEARHPTPAPKRELFEKF